MMKKIAVLLIVTLVLSVFSSCGSPLPEADYESPKAVIEAHEAINPEWKNNSIYDDLAGKTFIVKTTKPLDKSDPLGGNSDSQSSSKEGYNWLCFPYSDIEIDVFLSLTDEQWEKIEYKKGDTLILQVDSIGQRGTANGKIRQYYIMAYLAETA